MSITTVVMGFLQICSGVILLQLSKSAKDVPDAAVFKGDLNQVRTVAEQEESEFEPHADAVRGSAFIARSMSTSRQKREVQEAKRIQEERMEPIGENEQVQWDGIRRRKTLVEHSLDGDSSKSVHPPLGMSHFPTDDSDTESMDDGHHPGIIPRLKNHNYTAWIPHSLHNITSRHANHNHSTPTVQLKGLDSSTGDEPPSHINEGRRHTFGLPPGLRSNNTRSGSHKFDISQETAYSSQMPHLSNNSTNDGVRRSSHLLPPTPPPHSSTTKRQFSFSNVFNRKKSADSTHGAGGGGGGGGSSSASAVRGLSFRSTHASHDPATEEERLGLVKGDSVTTLPYIAGKDRSGAGSSVARSETGSEQSDDKTEIITDSPPTYDSEGEGYLNVRKKTRRRESAESPGATRYQQPTGDGSGERAGARGRRWDDDDYDYDEEDNRTDLYARGGNNNDIGNNKFGQGNSFV